MHDFTYTLTLGSPRGAELYRQPSTQKSSTHYLINDFFALVARIFGTLFCSVVHASTMDGWSFFSYDEVRIQMPSIWNFSDAIFFSSVPNAATSTRSKNTVEGSPCLCLQRSQRLVTVAVQSYRMPHVRMGKSCCDLSRTATNINAERAHTQQSTDMASQKHARKARSATFPRHGQNQCAQGWRSQRSRWQCCHKRVREGLPVRDALDCTFVLRRLGCVTRPLSDRQCFGCRKFAVAPRRGQNQPTRH